MIDRSRLLHSALRAISSSPDPNVRIWEANLAVLSATLMEELERILDESELARAERFHFANDRKHFVLTRGLLRVLLGNVLARDTAEISFVYGAHGKPALAPAHDSDVRFNLSHAHGRVLFAVAHGVDIGIDLEAVGRLPINDGHLSSLAARILSERELAVWLELPDLQSRQIAFLRAWTRKEACVKATGDGLFSGLQQIEVALDAAKPAGSLTIHGTEGDAGLTSSWIVHDLAVPEGFCAALAIEEKSRKSLADSQPQRRTSNFHA